MDNQSPFTPGQPPAPGSDPFQATPTPPNQPYPTTPQAPQSPMPQAAPSNPVAGPVFSPGQTVSPDAGPAMIAQPGPQPAATVSSFGGPLPQSSGTTGKKRKLPVVLAILAVVVLLLGGSAAAYFGVVVPNKPENVLKTAFRNTLEQKSVTAAIKAEGKDKDSPAYKFESTIKSTTNKPQAASADLKVTVTGVTISAEVRLVDNAMYIKIGDLSNITNLLGTAAPQYESLVKSLNSKLTEQWIVFDSTILQETGLTCVLDVDSVVTDADFTLMENLYKQSAFITIDSSAKDTVDGRDATKYELTVDPKKADKFAEGLKDLSFVKKANACNKKSDKSSSGDTDITNSLNSISTNDASPAKITVWVDKGKKLITKVSGEASAAEKKQGVSGNLTATMSYDPVTITKPENAKPFLTVITELAAAAKADPTVGPTLDQFLGGL